MRKGCFRRGRWSGTQKFVYQKRPKQDFPNCKLRFYPQWSLLVWGSGEGQGCSCGEGTSEAAQRRLNRRLEEVAKAVGGGYCRLQMPLKLARAVRETVAGRRLGGLEGGGRYPPPFQCIPRGGVQGGGGNPSCSYGVQPFEDCPG